MISAAASFALLRASRRRIAWVAARAGRPRNPRVRIALANLYRPGAATGSVVLSLGLGLTLFVSVAMIEGNLAAQIDEEIPKDAPAFFFLDIQSDQIDAFDKAIAAIPGARNFTRVPTLRGAITKIKGVPVEEAEIAPDARWAVRGDRNLTYLADLPAHNEIVAGEWWPKDYSGPPLISFDAGLAQGMGVGVGDTLTFNILGPSRSRQRSPACARSTGPTRRSISPSSSRPARSIPLRTAISRRSRRRAAPSRRSSARSRTSSRTSPPSGSRT